MKRARKVLIFLLLVGVVAALALLLVVATERGRELVMDIVASNVDGHPTLDTIVERSPNDCEKCHY